MSAFRICASSKGQTTNKVCTLVKVKFGRFWQIHQFPGIGEFYAIFLNMEVTLANGHYYAHNFKFLASKVSWGQRLICKFFCLYSKIRYLIWQPLKCLKWKNAIAIWYLYANELFWDFRGHIDLKQPRNYKFRLGWAQAKSTQSHLGRSIDFCGSRNFLTQTYSESSQNSRLINVL